MYIYNIYIYIYIYILFILIFFFFWILIFNTYLTLQRELFESNQISLKNHKQFKVIPTTVVFESDEVSHTYVNADQNLQIKDTHREKVP